MGRSAVDFYILTTVGILQCGIGVYLLLSGIKTLVRVIT